MQPGDAFLYEFPHNGKHLCIVVSTALDESQKKVLRCVYLTTVRNTGYEDLTCIFRPGDHPFLRHESYVDYSQILIVYEEFLLEKLSIQFGCTKDPITPKQLQKIKEGALRSPAIRKKNQILFND